MRLTVKQNLNAILLAAGVAALLASPAMAKSHVRHHYTGHNYTAPGTVYVPNNAYGYYVPNNAYGYVGPSQGTLSDWWRATHSGSWDATHDPRENPSF